MREFEAFGILNGKWAGRSRYVDMAGTIWSALIRSLRNASVPVTGRHHAVHAAGRARTPFLVMPGNTHKSEGLIKTSDRTVPAYRSQPGTRAASKDGAFPDPAYARPFDWMERQRPWRVEAPDAS